MENPALYQLALHHINGIGPVYTKELIARFGDAASIFRADRSALERTSIGADIIDSILRFSDFDALKKELQLLERKNIRPLFFTDPDYPRRLLRCNDAPPLLFYKGAANLNAEKIIAIVGTRTPTEYGKRLTEQLIRDLAQPNLLIISGLAFGIDAAAHTAALQHHIPTIGVLGHGFHRIYPTEHTGLARSMQQQGGLLTSFRYSITPERHNFPIRNRIVAGLCDALLVIESGSKGGSLLTAEDARKLNKKVFALPGRITDEKSRGCLRLIAEKNAEPLLSAAQFQASMGWHWPAGRNGRPATLPFPPDSETQLPPSHPQQQIITLLRQKETLSVDELTSSSQLNSPSIATSLLELEMNGLVLSLPGKRYRLSS